MKYSYSNMGSYLYSRLPHYHRVADEQNELLLKRFMEVLNVGFKTNDDALTQALHKTRASKCGDESLIELARSLGADWISTIDPKYQRIVIRMLIKLYKQKGTIDTIRFIASELSGFEAKIIEGEIPTEYFEEGDEKKRLLTVKLQAPELDDPVQAQQHETTIAEVINKFVPVHTKCILVVTYFYTEDFYRRVPYNDTSKLNQDLGERFKVFRDDYDIRDRFTYRYETESNFKMIGHPDVLGLTNNPLYTTTGSFHTTLTRYDILHHSTLVIKTEYEKTYREDEWFFNKLFQDWDEKSPVVLGTSEHFKHNLTTKYESVFTLPQLNTESEQIASQTISNNTGEDESEVIKLSEDRKDISKLTELTEQVANLDIKYDKVERVMVQSILEDEPITDLGIHKYALRTSKPSCKLSTREGRLTIPSYIDKIYVNGSLTYIYE